MNAELRGLTNRLTAYRFVRKLMSVQDLKEALRDIPGSQGLTVQYGAQGNQVIHIGHRTIEVGPMASGDEIRAKLTNPFNGTDTKPMSISGYEPGSIKAKLEALKNVGKQRRDAALAKLDDAGKKHEAVNAEIESIAGQIEKEASDALQEFAEFSNGGPV